MRRDGVLGIARLVVPVLLLLLALPLLLAACSDDEAGTSGSTGAWVPEKGALTFEAGGAGSGYEYDPNAAKPAGGVIVAENGGTYRVTLVSADGIASQRGRLCPRTTCSSCASARVRRGRISSSRPTAPTRRS